MAFTQPFSFSRENRTATMFLGREFYSMRSSALCDFKCEISINLRQLSGSARSSAPHVSELVFMSPIIIITNVLLNHVWPWPWIRVQRESKSKRRVKKLWAREKSFGNKLLLWLRINIFRNKKCFRFDSFPWSVDDFFFENSSRITRVKRWVTSVSLPTSGS